MNNSTITVVVSGNYPRSVINEALKKIDQMPSSDFVFVLGNCIDDENFDFSLSSLADIASLVSTGLGIAQLVIYAFEKKSKNKVNEKELNEELKKTKYENNYRTNANIINDLPGRVTKINICISSKIHLESLELEVVFENDRNKVEIKIDDIKRG